MAITWHVTVSNVDIATGRANVTATRVNPELADSEKTYTMQNTPFETPEERANVIAGLKGWLLQDDAKALAAKTYIGTFESDAKVDLETWELTVTP